MSSAAPYFVLCMCMSYANKASADLMMYVRLEIYVSSSCLEILLQSEKREINVPTEYRLTIP